MQKIVRRTVWILAVAAMVLMGLIYHIIRGARFNTPVKIGGTLPDIQAQTVGGQSFTLDTLRGQPILLNFFTPWCQPCIQETPDLVAFDKKYGKDIHVVMIDRGDDPVLVQHYVSQYHLPKNITVLLSQDEVVFSIWSNWPTGNLFYHGQWNGRQPFDWSSD